MPQLFDSLSLVIDNSIIVAIATLAIALLSAALACFLSSEAESCVQE